jgi:adenine-specific DNA-methyltransferase
MSKELLQAIIDNGVSKESLNSFFYDVSDYYTEQDTALSPPKDPRFNNLEMLGEIIFSPTQKLVVVTAKVNDNLSERSSKKAQYEAAKRVLKDLQKYDAGIFVFYDNNHCFRFSLVYAQYAGTKINFSNFHRFTYFVDPKQTNRTFKERVGQCLFASLDELKDAFSVEKVNKEFYKQIADYYYALTGKNGKARQLVLPYVAQDDTKKFEEFSVRLIGRSVFCWFLKHKTSNAGLPLISNAILSSGAVANKRDYYHLVLEKLFFSVMNKQISNRDMGIALFIPDHKNIPFLNGGLFEPHDHDYPENGGLKITDAWFADFFQLLEQYNFTIDENSTVDAEVSVDPEMMGRIFENLLAEVNPETGETARKATGSYYTPRVIVDYMVEQSLRQYLLTKTDLGEDKIDSLLSYENEIADWLTEQKESVVKAFKEIKIIDPACGSGAFPMGILHRMLLALEKVDPELIIWRREFLKSLDQIVKATVEKNIRKENWSYIRKLMIIRDSIYGVDIQPIAVEISKLRCFLSLVVDEIVSDKEENRGIEPLPNLEFKFVAANSLISLPKEANQSAFGVTEMVAKLKVLREKYLRIYGPQKMQIEQEFRDAQGKLFNENVSWLLSDKAKKLVEWNPFSYDSSTWFEPEWMFGVIGGFDIVIANPPYIRQEDIKEQKPELKRYFTCYTGTSDIYIYFYERGIQLLKPGGTLTYISSNKYFRTGYGEKLRILIGQKTQLIQIIDFGDAPVFDAITYPSIIIFNNVIKQENQLCALVWKDKTPIDQFESIISRGGIKITQSELGSGCWIFEAPITHRLLEKLNETGQPLGRYVDEQIFRGILTGLNEAFIVNRNLRDKLIKENSSADKLLKPFLRGKDIKRWRVEFAEQYLISIESSDNRDHPWSGKPMAKAESIFSEAYPSIYKWLLPQKEKLIKREDQGKYYWELRPCKYWGEFNKNKIVYQEIATYPHFAFDESRALTSKTAFFIPSDDLFLLGILNSSLVLWFLKNTCSSIQGGALTMQTIYLSKVPIVTPSTQQPIIELVREILRTINNDNSTDVEKQQRQIDEIVYQLYSLTPDEIELVESSRS